MKALAAAVFTASLVAIPAFADTIKEERVVIQESVQAAPPATGVIILEQQASDPFPHQGSDNPSGVLGQNDLRSENENVETRKGISEETLENQPGELDPRETQQGSVVVVPAPSVAAPSTGVIILEEQTASDPFPHQGSDNPSGVLGQQDLRSESAGPETRMGESPTTMGNQPGELDPREVR